MTRKLAISLYKIFGWCCIGIAISLVFLRLICHYLMPSPAQLEKWVKTQLTYPTKIAGIALTFEGYQPAITLSQVQIYSPESPDQEKMAANIDKIHLLLRIPQLLMGRLQLEKLSLVGANLGIEYDEKGSISVSGLPELKISLNEEVSTQKIPLLTELDIHDSHIHFMLGDKKSLPLTQVKLWMHSGTSIKVRAQATVVGLTHSHIDFGAELPLWGLSLHAKEKHYYCHWVGADLEQLEHFIPKNLPLKLNGLLDFTTWLSFNNKNEFKSVSQIELVDRKIDHDNGDLAFNKTTGELYIDKLGEKWSIQGQNWAIPANEKPLDFKIIFSENGEQKHLNLETHHLSLSLWEKGIIKSGLLPSPLLGLVESCQLEGSLDYALIDMAQNQEDWNLLNAQMVFEKIGVKSQTHQRGLNGLSGAFIYEGSKGILALHGEKGELFYPDLFYQGMPYSKAHALVEFEKLENEWVFDMVDFQTNLNDNALLGNMVLHFAPDKKWPTIDLFLETSKMKIGNLLSLLPRGKMDHELIHWLEFALAGGEGTVNSSVILRGNLAHFPFDQREGIFEAQLQLENTDFAYDKHWPQMTQLNADLLFHNRSLFIHAHEGKIAGGKILDADAVIPDLYTKTPVLTVDADIASNLQNGIKILNQSPLQQTVAKTLAPLTFEGEMELSLGLMIPLSVKSAHDLKIKGIIEVMDATVMLPWNIEAKELKGSVSFTQNSIKAEKLQGQLLDGPAQIEIDTLLTSGLSPQMQFQVQGHVKLATLEKLLKINPQDSNTIIQGEADYAAKLIFSPEPSAKQMSLIVHSDLVGIHIQAPAPFGKAVNESKASEFKLNIDNNDLIRLAFKYGDDLNGVNSLILAKGLWHPMGGHLHFGENRLAKFREDGIFLIDGDIKELNIQEWKQFLNQSGLLQVVASTPAADSEHPLERMLQLQTKNLVLLDHHFPKTKVEAQWDRDSSQWNIHLDGNAIKGMAMIPQAENKRDIIINLESLILAKNQPISEMLSSHALLTNPISLQIKKLLLGKKSIHQISARIEPSAGGFYFPKVKASLTGTQVNCFGQWDNLLPSKQVFVKGKMHTTDISLTLKELGIKSTLKKAKGNMSFSLKWDGSPGEIDYPSLNGQAEFNLTDGYIQGVNPGIGRVLSLVNLDNVQRRLNFDFSDVTHKGFAFDELTGKCQFGKGKISSNNVIIKGPAAKIEAVGQADLISQALVGEIVVMPNVTASLPVAAAIAAGNPAVGAAVWVVDKMVGNKIQEINRLRYHIAGTWQSPQVNQVPFYQSERS